MKNLTSYTGIFFGVFFASSHSVSHLFDPSHPFLPPLPFTIPSYPATTNPGGRRDVVIILSRCRHRPDRRDLKVSRIHTHTTSYNRRAHGSLFNRGLEQNGKRRTYVPLYTQSCTRRSVYNGLCIIFVFARPHTYVCEQYFLMPLIVRTRQQKNITYNKCIFFLSIFLPCLRRRPSPPQ